MRILLLRRLRRKLTPTAPVRAGAKGESHEKFTYNITGQMTNNDADTDDGFETVEIYETITLRPDHIEKMKCEKVSTVIELALDEHFKSEP